MANNNTEEMEIDIPDVSMNSDLNVYNAIVAENYEALDLLLDGDNINSVFDNETGTDSSPINIAAANGKNGVVEYLLNKGADIDGQIDEGDYATPIMSAIENNHFDTVMLLHEKQASLTKAGAEYETPLHVAAANGYIPFMEFLLDNGVDVNIGYEGYTPLVLATMWNEADAVEFLIEHGADIENAKDGLDNNPLTCATIMGYHDIVALIKENAPDITGDEPALIAEQAHFYEE